MRTNRRRIPGGLHRGMAALVCVWVCSGAWLGEAGEVSTDILKVWQESALHGTVTIAGLTVPTNALNLHYGFADDGTPVPDLSGNGNTGTVVGATWTGSGKLGGGYDFDGTNDYIEAADSTSLDIRGAFTISAWVRRAATSDPWGVYCILAKHDDLTDRAYNLYVNGSYVTCQMSSSGSGTQLYAFRTASTVALTNWRHVVVQWGGVPNAGGRIYIDGVEQALTINHNSFSGTNIYNSSQPLRVGSKSNGGWYFPGTIDDVRLYDRALSEGEIQGLFQEGGTNTGLLWVESPTVIRQLVPQGDVGMGPYTNGP